MSDLPTHCPSCTELLQVKRFECQGCGTVVEGRFALPTLMRLGREEQDFILNVAKCSGSLKELAGIYGVSYPTVRNRMDALIERIQAVESTQIHKAPNE